MIWIALRNAAWFRHYQFWVTEQHADPALWPPHAQMLRWFWGW
jgi:hypothetical protein